MCINTCSIIFTYIYSIYVFSLCLSFIHISSPPLSVLHQNSLCCACLCCLASVQAFLHKMHCKISKLSDDSLGNLSVCGDMSVHLGQMINKHDTDMAFKKACSSGAQNSSFQHLSLGLISIDKLTILEQKRGLMLGPS